MRKSQYQQAFSRLEPSQGVLDRIAAHTQTRPTRPKARLGLILAAALAAVCLLGGTVYAAAHWFTLRPAIEVTDPPRVEKDAPVQPETQPAPQTVIEIEVPQAPHYIGFTLPETYRERIDRGNGQSMAMLLADLGNPEGTVLTPDQLAQTYARYYALSEGDGTEFRALCIQLLGASTTYQQFFTRYEILETREGTLCDMDTVWLRLEEPEIGESYNLFLRNEILGCVVVISSSESFAEAEQAARDMTLVDSGVPVAEIKNVFCGLRMPPVPEGLELWGTPGPLTHRLSTAELADPDQDLSQLYYAITVGNATGRQLHVYLTDRVSAPSFGECEEVVNADGSTGIRMLEAVPIDPVNGYEAWRLEQSDGGCILKLWSREAGCMLNVYATAEQMRQSPDQLLEFARSLELVELPMVKEPAVEFRGLAAG